MSILSLTKKEYEELDLIHSDTRGVHINIVASGEDEDDPDEDEDFEELHDDDADYEDFPEH